MTPLHFSFCRHFQLQDFTLLSLLSSPSTFTKRNMWHMARRSHAINGILAELHCQGKICQWIMKQLDSRRGNRSGNRRVRKYKKKTGRDSTKKTREDLWELCKTGGYMSWTCNAWRVYGKSYMFPWEGFGEERHPWSWFRVERHSWRYESTPWVCVKGAPDLFMGPHLVQGLSYMLR